MQSNMTHRLLWLYCSIVSVASPFELCTLKTVISTPSNRYRLHYQPHQPSNIRTSSLTLVQSIPNDDITISAPPTATSTLASTIDVKKEGVKIFGRLAEKYIALDSSGGNCCYSGCTGCEYRLPDGGYKMADQTAARPKWIPHYDTRVMSNHQHTTKWYTHLFLNPNVTAISQDEFVNAIVNLEYTPPLGGPYMSASAAHITDTALVQKVFEVLAEGKTKLTKFKMSVRIKQLSNGEEGMTWQAFERLIESIA